jgi:toxin HigB-1
MWQVTWSKRVDKELRRTPVYIQKKFQAWAVAVETVGMAEVRKLPGYHDEPLKGARQGQRSIRLSRSYRAIYRETMIGTGRIELIEVVEVNKHEY